MEMMFDAGFLVGKVAAILLMWTYIGLVIGLSSVVFDHWLFK